MKPQLVIDHRAKVSKMEDLTIESCKNNVSTYLTKMQEMRNEIDSLQKDKIKKDEQRFLTLTFNKLGKTSGDLLVDVMRQRSEWVNNSSVFNTSTFIADVINLYTNYKSTGKWYKQGAKNKKVLVALATFLKQVRSKNKKSPGNPTSSKTKTPTTENGNSTGLTAWKFNNVGKTTTYPDTRAKYEGCKLHGREN